MSAELKQSGDKPNLPPDTKMIEVFIMGKRYKVPATLTIQKAIEWAGFQFLRGCGCRGGICGACPTIYRTQDDYKLKIGLACQTVVEDGMYLVQLPFVPAQKSIYHIEEERPTIAAIEKHYPETFRCVQCNTCTKACPMDIEVVQYIAEIIKGDYKKAAELSSSCIMCGMCAARCPAELQQFNVAMFVRRMYGRHVLPKAEHLQKRVKEINENKYIPFLDELGEISHDELVERYKSREWQPEPYEDPNWQPKETKYL